MSDIIFILITGVFIALLIYVFLYNKKHPSQYDERQRLLRGKAFHHAFFTVLLWEAACLVYNCIGYAPIMEHGVSSLIAICLGVGVFATECILRDAFVQMNQTPGLFIWIYVVTAATNCLTAIEAILDGELLHEGVLLLSGMCRLAVGVTFLIVAIVLIVKTVSSNRREKE